MPEFKDLGHVGTKFESPGVKHFAITPQDGVDLVPRPRVMIALTEGFVSMRDEAGTIITYPVVPGYPLMFSAVGVEATGTTATVVGWY